MQVAAQQLLQLYRNMRLMAFLVLPLARVSQESLTAVYARTFEKAAFGFAKVRVRTQHVAQHSAVQRGQRVLVFLRMVEACWDLLT